MFTPKDTPIKASLKPKIKELGDGFTVRRALPMISHRSVGPWVCFDHFEPVDYAPEEGMDVRLHPHIGIATVTYLFEGEIWYRDNLGNSSLIEPVAINLMVAGSGIVHSEHTRDALRAKGYQLHGLQLWFALPDDQEGREANFHHHSAASIPEANIPGGARVRVMIGSAFGLTSPVEMFFGMFYCQVDLPDGATITLPPVEESEIYVVQGCADIDGEVSDTFVLSILGDDTHLITAQGRTKLAVIGGAPLGKRHIWWNFASSRPERIRQAAEDWWQGRFPTVHGDETEHIPLPDEMIF